MRIKLGVCRFWALLCISSVLSTILPSIGSTGTVGQGKSDASGCSLLDSQKPSIYLARDTLWNEPETVRMVLRNNSTCRVTLVTTGKQTIIKLGGKISQLSDPVAEDGASVVLRYKVNSVEEPWAFIHYWPYGDTVSTLTLNGGHSIKFIVSAEHLRRGRKIAVPFHYEWEGFLGSSGIEHLVYSPID